MSTHHLDSIDEQVQRHADDTETITTTTRDSTEAINADAKATNAVVWTDKDFIDSRIRSLGTSVRARRVENADIAEQFPLLGVPILVKELDSPIAGTPNSWGNKTLKEERYCDDHTATSVELLQQSGAVIVGKTNNPELGLEVTTHSSAHGECLNPLDTTRNSGGSSGGSAAAVASGMVRVAMGGDGGGSIRIPAACCGVFGMKPSRGMISAGPIISEAWAGLATKGVIAQSVTDIATVLDVVKQRDSASSYNAHIPTESFRSSIEKDCAPLKIGFRTHGFGNLYTVDPAIQEATQKATEFLQSCGHHVEESSPSTYDDLSIIDSFMTIIASHTVHDVQELIRRSRSQLSINTCENVTQFFYDDGLKKSITDYLDARVSMEIFTRTTSSWFENYDVLITPTIARVAPMVGEVESDPELAPFLYSGLCMASNFTGSPAISIPVNCSHNSGLPAGLQIVARRDNDSLILALARLFERDYSDIFINEYSVITK